MSPPTSLRSSIEPRHETIPISIVKPGGNLPIVRVRREDYEEGLPDLAGAISVAYPTLKDSKSILLSDLCHFQVENNYGYRNPNASSQLFNAKVAPFRWPKLQA